MFLLVPFGDDTGAFWLVFSRFACLLVQEFYTLQLQFLADVDLGNQSSLIQANS